MADQKDEIVDIETMQRYFKGIWIPKEIWLSKNLKLIEKCFLVEIDSLDNNEDGCYASNEYFSDFFNLSKNRCSEIINKLKKKGFIKIDYVRSQGKKNIEKRVIHLLEKSKGGIRKTDRSTREIEGGYSENCEDNNILLNNISNNIDNDNVNFRWKDILIVWNDLPEPIKKIHAITELRKEKIQARINNLKINLDDILKAIKNISNCKFLQGENNRGWVIDFDWLFKDDTRFTRVLENKYQKTSNTNTTSQYNTNVQAGIDLVKKYEDEESQGNEGEQIW